MKLFALLTVLLTFGACSSSSKHSCGGEGSQLCDTHSGTGQCLERTNPNVPAHPMHRNSPVNDLR